MEIQHVSLIRVLAVGLGAGLLFAVGDGLLNANPLAQRLNDIYRPIVRESVNAPLGAALDLIFGIVMGALFVLLAPALPGNGIAKGAAFGLIAWFFRVAMGTASQVVMFRVTTPTAMYWLLTGLAEMMMLGIFYGALLRPR